MNVTGILLCAGKGERMGPGPTKALVPLAGRPLFAWSLEALQRSPAIATIVVVGPVTRLKAELAAAGLPDAKVTAWCEGGRERQDSVARGLAALPADCTLVAVHDCARPLVSRELVARVVGDALLYGAAIAALPVADTIKRGSLDAVEATVPRAGLWCAQTPQAFRRDWLEAAHAQTGGSATDDAALVESLGHRVHLTPGDALNFKITEPRHLELAEAWLSRSSARA
ncbi:MAG TPA: 2-C-methyl-D-erythritol 4-phosphate cytidylyltransferase [Candidatus Eisenbacteria bacterium]|jgi:2-C-methyl-D-erythritol 4-phosphate cytidylyltransferase